MGQEFIANGQGFANHSEVVRIGTQTVHDPQVCTYQEALELHKGHGT